MPTGLENMIKKELAGYSRVPGSSDQKTDSGRFGLHPTHEPTEKTFKCEICDYSTSRPRYLKQHKKSISHINREKSLQQTEQREG